jgi:cytochrome c oxidase subunit 3
VCVLISLVFLALRGLEFTTLNVSWHANAYGSVVWLLLGLHTTHLITDTVDTTVLAVLLYTGPFEGKRFVDVSENALYWYFVVGAGCRSTRSSISRRSGEPQRCTPI